MGPTRALAGPSALWSEYARVIEEFGPDWIVFENVAHAWRKWVPVVREALLKLGYESLHIKVRSSDLGAPHRRARIWLIAHSDGQRLRELRWWWEWKGREEATQLGRSWLQEPGVPRMDDGVPNRVERRHAIGNAACPQIARLIAKGIKAVTKEN